MKWLVIAIMTSLCVSLCSCSNEYKVTDYNLKLYFLGGSVDTIKITSLAPPHVKSFRGSYRLRYVTPRGCAAIEGVVRYEVLSESEPYVLHSNNKHKTIEQQKEELYHNIIAP